MKQHILTSNNHQIEGELSRMEATKKRFEPFHYEMKNTGFDFSVKEFQDLAYGNSANLILWLKEKTLQATPEINSMKANHEAKLNMVEVEDYSALHRTHELIPKDKKREVYSFDIKDGELVISETTKQQITDKHTTYGNDKALALLKYSEGIKEAAEKCKKETGVNPLEKIITFNRITGEIHIHIPGINFALQGH